MIFEYKSKVGKGDTRGVSSRVIIPKGIMKILDAQPGDHLTWKADIIDNKIVITVSKSDDFIR